MPHLYASNLASSLDSATFRNPPKEYRGAPFWSWNCRLDVDQLLRQIDVFDRMGLGGFHIHVRTGLATPYLGEEYMAAVRACTDEAARRGMRCYLYDEDRWPSGFAGGLVTQHPEFRAKHLLFTPTPYCGKVEPPVNISNSWANRTENGVLLAAYDVVLDEAGYLAHYQRVENPQGPHAWYAYVESPAPIPWYNHQTYVDTLNPDAIRKFIEVTHETYRREVGEHFGGVVPSMFTDEPQFTHKRGLNHPFERRDLFFPFTTDLADTYRAAFGQDLLDHLPELFWELPDERASVVRYRYHDHVAERFAAAFSDQCGAWCAQHGLLLTGHMMEEPTLETQTAALGEAMRSYRAFHVPGIDMLCDRIELTTAKQAQSAARQYGRDAVMSELYGVTNWDFDFAGHKRQGDWQAALGVTLRVHHLSWVSMAGEAKRDYPASISYQSPWYAEYPLVEDHFARLNSALTRGRPVCRVAVIHPVESYWLAFGPTSQTEDERHRLDESFQTLTHDLLHGLVDFDFVAESLLPSQGVASDRLEAGGTSGADAAWEGGTTFGVGEMAYDAVVLPPMRTIRGTTLDRLEAFAAAGGTVFLLGDVPTHVDALPSDRPARLPVTRVSPAGIVPALQAFREVDVRRANGSRPGHLLYQLRADGNARILFVCNTSRSGGHPHAEVAVRGTWWPTLLDTLTGEIRDLPARHELGWTKVTANLPACGSLLLRLAPTAPAEAPEVAPMPTWQEVSRLTAKSVTLSEPNVRLLDRAFFRIDGGDWQGPEELLRIQNRVRANVGLPPSDGQIAQPWTEPAVPEVLARVELRFTVDSEIEAPVSLALEDARNRELRWNGTPVAETPDADYFVDEAIRVLPLPTPLKIGENELTLAFDFDVNSTVEWAYLLGEFGVDGLRVVAPALERLDWGDWTRQGLPFYAGNVTYRVRIVGDGRPLRLRVPHYRAPLVTVDIDGQRVGAAAFPPYEIELGALEGEHEIALTAYGSRINAFGPLHNWDPNVRWYGPWAWRSRGEAWGDGYNLRAAGILTAPIVYAAVQPEA